MENNKKEIELRSVEYQEIVSQSPRWLIRSGIVLVLGLLLILIGGSYFFKYPDIINADIVVVSENPPAYLAARTTARIDSLFVQDNELINAGHLVAILENPANFEDAYKLKEMLIKLEPFLLSFDTLLSVKPEIGLKLGEIQSDYSGFVRLYNDYFTFLRLKLHSKKINALKKQLSNNKTYTGSLQKQKQDMQSDYLIVYKQFKRDSLLHLKDVISDFDLEKTKTLLIQKKHNLNAAFAKLAETQGSTIKLELEIVEVEMDFAEQNKKAQNALIESAIILKSRFTGWEQTYIIINPIEGKISFTEFWSKNQQVKKDEIIFSVIPEGESKIIGRMNLPVSGSGKVAAGQKVNIRFDNYPYMEYGFVKGTVKNISLVPSNDVYTVEVEMPQDLKSNYNINLMFSQEMKGKAEIVTNELRLLQRLINPLRSIIKHRVYTEE